MIITKPVKVTWRAYLDNISDPKTESTDSAYKIIKSEKLRKNLKRLEGQLTQLGLRVEVQKDLRYDIFLNWLDIYKEVLDGKKEGRIKIDQSWLDKKQKEGKTAFGVFLYNNDVLLGGNIGVLREGTMTVGYGVLLPFDTKFNLGAFVDFVCIKLGLDWGYKLVSFGQDTNLYGAHLSTGLFSHKARLGLTIEAKKDKGWEKVDTDNLTINSDILIFLGDDKTLHVLYRNEKPMETEFGARGVERIEFVKI